MLFREIAKKYATDLILLIRFKKIISAYIGKICTNYGGISFTCGIFNQNPRELWWVFCLKFHIFGFFLGG